MPDFQLNVRVGGTKQSTAESAPEFVAKRMVDVLRRAAEEKGSERVLEALVENQVSIIQDIARDANRFGEQAARVFTRVRSPAPGNRVTISLDDVSERTGTLVSSINQGSAKLQGKTTVEWMALHRSTLANKRANLRARRKKDKRIKGTDPTFFVDTGALRTVLTTYLGPAMAMLVDPKIVVRRGPRKVTVTLSVLSQASGKEKAGVTAQSLPQAYGGRKASAGESLFIRYLIRAGAKDDGNATLEAKLTNPRSFKGAHRPFLQNTLVYWISRRMPLVLDKSLKRVLAAKIKKVK